jgi:hypothetical protein
VVGIITGFCNGVTNVKIFFSFKTKSSYKNSDLNLLKTLLIQNNFRSVKKLQNCKPLMVLIS